MRLEEELKQKKFEHEHEKLAVNIMFTASWLDTLSIKRFKPLGLTSQQYNVLRILRGSHPKKLMLFDIASRMIDKNSNATRLVEKLRLNGLVNREQCPTDRRQVDITITQKGLDLLKQVDQGTEDWLKELKQLNQTEAKLLNDLLDKLRG